MLQGRVLTVVVLCTFVAVAIAATKTSTSTLTATPSKTPSNTPTISNTPSNTPTPSRTPSISVTGTRRPSNLPSGWPISRTVTGVLRDFHGINEGDCSTSNRICALIPNGCWHNDFERAIANDRGLVLPSLGPDRLPIWDSTKFPSSTITSLELANMWFRTQDPITVNGKTCYINQPYNMSLTVVWDASRALYTYTNGAFWPIDGQLGLNYPNLDSTHNFHFTFELHSRFIYAGLETFSFTGDDDVWVFVDNRLVLDLGGVHGAQVQCFSLIQPGQPGYPNGQCSSASCDGGTCIGNLVSKLNLTVGQTYNFDFFFAERHQTQSNINFATNFPLDTCLTPDACGICNGPNTVDVCSSANPPNCGDHGHCVCATGGCVCDAGWTGPSCDSFCGDGIIQSAEQCDDGTSPTGCCTSSCRFAANTTVCPSAGNPCIEYRCNGAGTCGVPRDTVNGVAISCGSAIPGEPCLRDICQNGACARVPQPVGLDCGSSSCTQRQCNATGKCATTQTVQCVAAGICYVAGTCVLNSNNNQFPGTCSNPPVSFGTSCGSSGNVCQDRLCDGAGNCTFFNKAEGTVCGAPTDCTASQCLNGQCTIVNTNAGNTCGASPPQCNRNSCTSGSCTQSAFNEGGSCTGTGLTSATCQRYSCSSGACVIVNQNEGGACSLGASATSCTTGVCSAGACVAVAANQGAVCTSGSNGVFTDTANCTDRVCQGTQCALVNVNSGLVCSGGPAISLTQCNRNTCNNGTCSTVSFNDGGSCPGSGLTSATCQRYSCSSGACVIVSQNEGSTCTLASPNSCSVGKCSAGACVAVAANQGAVCSSGSNGAAPSATQCQAPRCLGTECLLANINEGSTFTVQGTGCPALTTPNCTQYRCVSGSCLVEARRVGQSCSASTACQQFLCQSNGTCLPSAINEDQVCAGAGTCSPSKCDSGTCTSAPIVCTPPSNCFTIGPCVSGVCPAPVLTLACSCGNNVTEPASGEQCDTGSVDNPCCDDCVFSSNSVACGTDTECKQFRCTGSSTACNQINQPAGTSCSEKVADECNSVQCDGNGGCVFVAKTGNACGSPTDCQTAQCGTGTPTTRAQCLVQPRSNGTSCTLSGSRECHSPQCLNGACTFTYVGAAGAACTLSDTECATAQCDATLKGCKLVARRATSGAPAINCTTIAATACAIPQCGIDGSCSLVPTPGVACTVAGYTPDGCADQVCNAQGTCALVNRANNLDCSAASGLSAECQKATCSSGKCGLVFDNAASCTSLVATECADPVCDSTTRTCRYSPKRATSGAPAINCTTLTATDCAIPQCGIDGSCSLVPTPGVACSIAGFVSDGCSSPACSASGVCVPAPVVDNTACVPLGLNADCQIGQCRQGVCTAVSKRQTASDPAIDCSSVQDTPCEVAQCGLDGLCSLVSLADGVQASCASLKDPNDVCAEMLCESGSCNRVLLASGTSCTDSNLCDTDTCNGQGECVRVPTSVADGCAKPLGPCYSAGWCEPTTGACNYTQFAAGAACTPSVPDPAGCRFFTCTADAECTKACVVRTVCGNGVVETGEECDWAARAFTSRCCTRNCTWVGEFGACNATRNMTELLDGVPKGKLQFQEICLQDYCSAEHSCVSIWNQTVEKVCALGSKSQNTAYIAGVSAGLAAAACLALAVAACAVGLFLWQMKKTDNAWKKEFLDEYRGVIEQNAAFVGSTSAPANPAYGLGN